MAPEPLHPLLEPDAQPGDPAAAGGMRGQDAASAGSWRGQQVRLFSDGTETVCVFDYFFFYIQDPNTPNISPEMLFIMTKHNMQIFGISPVFKL